MNSQEFRTAAKQAFALATQAHTIAFGAANAHQSYVFFKKAQDAYDAASAQWIADQHTADTMAQAELDATTAKGCEEVVEVVTEVTAAEVIANINTNEAFGTAWGADGQVLTYDETVAAIDAGRGWFDTQGRWVNKAGWEKQNTHLSAWVIAKLAN
jgi:hypothetical protein